MKIRTIELTDTQRKELEIRHNTGKNSTFRKRCQVILLKSQGRTSAEVGKILGMHQISVNNWLNRYEHEGIEGLQTKPGRGRKPILDAEKDAEVIKAAITEEHQGLEHAKNMLEEQLGRRFSTKTLKRFLKNRMPSGNKLSTAQKGNLIPNELHR